MTVNPLYKLCLKFKYGPERELIGALTLYRNVKDLKVTAVHWKTERCSRGNALWVNALYPLLDAANMRCPWEAFGVYNIFRKIKDKGIGVYDKGAVLSPRQTAVIVRKRSA